MFLFRSLQPRPAKLNAISLPACQSQAPAPIANDVAVLQRLIELAMQVAELAARQAAEDQTQAGPTRPRQSDSRLVFLRLHRAIRDTIALKSRLAAGTLPKQPRPAAAISPKAPSPTKPAEAAAPPPEDPRRPHILRYFREAIDITQKKRKTPLTQQDIEIRVSAELANDPQQKLSGQVVLLKICKSLDLPFYANRMHRELFRPPMPTTPAAIGPPP